MPEPWKLENRQRILSWQMNGVEYELQPYMNGYAVFSRVGLYSWQQETEPYATHMGAIEAFWSMTLADRNIF